MKSGLQKTKQKKTPQTFPVSNGECVCFVHSLLQHSVTTNAGALLLPGLLDVCLCSNTSALLEEEGGKTPIQTAFCWKAPSSKSCGRLRFSRSGAIVWMRYLQSNSRMSFRSLLLGPREADVLQHLVGPGKGQLKGQSVNSATKLHCFVIRGPLQC